ncbi:MAG: histidinol-phosphatase [Bacteroidales bacterium]|nr:histidinol-phosphatase [Bacteroidales bacterium]
MKNNFHTHSLYCDGKSPLPDIVDEANRAGYDQLGFTSHAPINHKGGFGIPETKIPQYLQEIRQLQEKQEKLQIFSGLECDYVPGLSRPFSYYKSTYHLDYLIGAVHLVKAPQHKELWFIDGGDPEIYVEGLQQLFGGQVEKAVTTYWEQLFEMIETESFDILAHADKIKMNNQKRFFTEEEPWYIRLAEHCMELARRKHLIVEINTRGIYKGRCPDYYPSDRMLKLIAQYHIPMVISTDAHKAEELTLGRTEAIEKIKSFGINHLMYIKNHQWEEFAI